VQRKASEKAGTHGPGDATKNRGQPVQCSNYSSTEHLKENVHGQKCTMKGVTCGPLAHELHRLESMGCMDASHKPQAMYLCYVLVIYL